MIIVTIVIATAYALFHLGAGHTPPLPQGRRPAPELLLVIGHGPLLPQSEPHARRRPVRRSAPPGDLPATWPARSAAIGLLGRRRFSADISRTDVLGGQEKDDGAAWDREAA
jgi:hypothetical protein